MDLVGGGRQVDVLGVRWSFLFNSGVDAECEFGPLEVPANQEKLILEKVVDCTSESGIVNLVL